MEALSKYIHDKKRVAIIGEVSSILHVVGIIGTMTHGTGFGADLKAIGALRSSLSFFKLARLIISKPSDADNKKKELKDSAMKLGAIIQSGAKLTGWVLTEFNVGAPLVAVCKQVTVILSPALTLGKLLYEKPSTHLTRPQQYLNLALTPLSMGLLGPEAVAIVPTGSLIVGLIGLRESQLVLRDIKAAEKTS